MKEGEAEAALFSLLVIELALWIPDSGDGGRHSQVSFARERGLTTLGGGNYPSERTIVTCNVDFHGNGITHSMTRTGRSGIGCVLFARRRQYSWGCNGEDI